jgi:2-octaprenyl-6-methoxyphenol hydroxylase
MLDVLGVKEKIQEFDVIKEILVVDGRVGDGAKRGGAIGLSLHFDDAEITETDEPLGFMVENRHTRLALDKVADTRPNIKRISPDSVVGFADLNTNIEVKLQSGKTIKSRLLVGADGRGSLVRREAGIKTNKFGYNQTGIVTTVVLEKPHNSVAYEYFLPSGPFAILPLPNNRASIVWSEMPSRASAIAELTTPEIEAELQKRFGDILGKVSICAPIFTYPLTLELAADWYRHRVVLAGDAAHGIHPVAGQGFNLGLKDVAALAEILVESHNLGLDIGDPNVLERYAAWRRTDTMMVALSCDAFVRLFSNDIAPLRFVRNLGLGIVDKIGPLRRFFARNAGGVIGELPKLLQGQAL